MQVWNTARQGRDGKKLATDWQQFDQSRQKANKYGVFSRIPPSAIPFLNNVRTGISESRRDAGFLRSCRELVREMGAWRDWILFFRAVS
jgi:hypothetical protein